MQGGAVCPGDRMSKYVLRMNVRNKSTGEPLYGWDAYREGRETMVVHESPDDSDVVLYDADGKPLTYQRRAIGFHSEDIEDG